MASRYDQYQLLRRLHEELYSTIEQYEVWPLRLLGAVPNSRRLPTVAGSAAELVRRGKA